MRIPKTGDHVKILQNVHLMMMMMNHRLVNTHTVSISIRCHVLELKITRGSRDVILEVDIGNRCGQVISYLSHTDIVPLAVRWIPFINLGPNRTRQAQILHDSAECHTPSSISIHFCLYLSTSINIYQHLSTYCLV